MTHKNTVKPIRHFLDLKDIAAPDLRHMIQTAKNWKSARRHLPKGAIDDGAILDGHALAMVFEKSSTRTRISFEMAMQQLGGKALILNSDQLQLGRGETVEDTARVLSRMVDAVMIRANHHIDVMQMAGVSGVPVINALTDRSHPCQLMADIMTYEESRGSVKGKKFAWVGDGNNVAVSLIEAAIKFEFSVILACPAELSIPKSVLNWATAQDGDVTLTTDINTAVAGADAVITDTWISMGDKDPEARHRLLAPYQVNDKIMALANDDAVFLHCLPAHRGEEVTASVIDGPQSIIWEEAENRLHAQKAIIAWCLHKI